MHGLDPDLFAGVEPQARRGRGPRQSGVPAAPPPLAPPGRADMPSEEFLMLSACRHWIGLDPAWLQGLLLAPADPDRPGELDTSDGLH